MGLHVKLDVPELPEPHAADLALIRLLSSVDQLMSLVVRVHAEGLAALLAFVRLFSRVLQLMDLERLTDDEPLPAHVTPEGLLSRVDPLVVVIGGFVEERLPARVAAVLHVTRVNELVFLQGTRSVEALVTGAAAERRHVHYRPVLPVDYSAPALLPLPSPHDLPVLLVMSYALVSPQVAVVQKRLPTQVAHVRL